MYIRGLIQRNSTELAEAIPRGQFPICTYFRNLKANSPLKPMVITENNFKSWQECSLGDPLQKSSTNLICHQGARCIVAKVTVTVEISSSEAAHQYCK